MTKTERVFAKFRPALEEMFRREAAAMVRGDTETLSKIWDEIDKLRAERSRMAGV